MKRKYIYIFFLFFFVLWDPIHAYIFPYDANSRMISVLGFLFILFGLPSYTKSFIENGRYFDLPFLLWVLWVIIDTIVFNPVLNPEIDASIIFIKTILPFLIYLSVRLNFSNVAIKNQWQWYSAALLSYLILVFIFEEKGSLPQYENRLGNYLNPNEIAWIALLTLFSSFIIIRRKYLTYFIVLLSLILILLTASKKALISFLLFFVLKYMFSRKISFVKKISSIMIFFFMIFITTPVLLKNTVIGERIQKSIEKNEIAEDDSKLFDGRANYYIVGFELFKNNLVTGIGVTNFYYLGGMEQEAHSEYVVQFAELGIVGLLLFILFHYRISSKLIKLNRKVKHDNIPLIMFISFLTIYSMFFGRWVYDNIPYNIFLALTVNTILSYNKKISVKLKYE